MKTGLNAFIGCDPGAKGQFCLLVPKTKQVAFMPTTEKPLVLLDWFQRIDKELNLVVTMIEDVHSIHGTSAKSNFNFGYNVGVVNTIPLSAGSTVDRVKPKVWQKHVGVKARSKTIKQDVADICDRLYPKVDIRGPRGGLLDGLSDALMIAHYASQTFKV